jgi:uncharacterized protein YegP (UPF0339 family)
MAGKFELKRGAGGKYHFNLKASNGRVILSSETYNDRAGAENGISSVKANAAADGRFERKESRKGEPYFVLKAANGEIIGKSEMYSSAAAMEKGIASVKANGPAATVRDLSETSKAG